MDYRTLGDVIYFYFALNTTAGTGSDATGTPTYQVREGGASASAAPTLTGNATLLSHASHVDGCYEVAITASAGNGFVANKQYGVFCTAAVSSVNPTGFLGSFILSPVRTDIAAAPTAAAIRTEIDSNSTKLDVAVSTRLASASYTAPPTVSAIRTEIDSNSTKLDVATSTRLASASYTAPDNATISSTASAVNAIGVIVTSISSTLSTMVADIWNYATRILTAGTNLNIPTSSQNATQVRSELTTELARIDVATSTRLASTSYKSPVVASGAITSVIDSLTFDTDLNFAVNSKFRDALLVITQAGNNQYERRPIESVDNDLGTGIVYIQEAFPSTPSPGDTFEIWGDHVHSLDTIKTETAQAVLSNADNWPTNQIGGIIKTIGTCLSGITSLANWLRVLARKDAGTAGMTTAQSEINTGGTATFDKTTDSLEGNADKSVSVVLDQNAIDSIAAGVVSGIQEIPGFVVEVTSPVDSTGTIQVTQGDAYLTANNRNIAIALTGSLPSIEAACTLRVFFGGTVTEYAGTRTVNSATSITLKFDLSGTQTAAMPVGTFQYEAEVTYASTTNKWTPSTGKFIVKGQL